MTGTVHIVHTIDTEGPLYEPLEARFGRLEELYSVSGIKPSLDNFRKLQRGEIDLGGKTEQVRQAIKSPKRGTLGSWEEINEMLERVTTPEFRNRIPDQDGNGWVFNWFCMDHVGYNINPRKRDIGHHHVHDRYLDLVSSQPEFRDTVEFHFHPVSTYREAHRCATHYLRHDDLYTILARRVIERDFFPACYRAGFQAERPDSHWFLEQFIPYDMSNMATEDTSDLDASIDFRNGRSGNWRNAPADWSVYRPSHDDYQKPGSCRRLIGRALNLKSRIASMTQVEMDKAFSRAQNGQDALVGLCSHDWRDLEPEISEIYEMLASCKERYPGVDFKYSQTKDAFAPYLSELETQQDRLRLSLNFTPEAPGKDVPFITVRTENGRVFGPQPFLAIRTRSQRFLHDNFDFDQTQGVWHYAFHGDTLPLDDVAEIGVGAADIQGNTQVLHFTPDRQG